MQTNIEPFIILGCINVIQYNSSSEIPSKKECGNCHLLLSMTTIAMNKDKVKMMEHVTCKYISHVARRVILMTSSPRSWLIAPCLSKSVINTLVSCFKLNSKLFLKKNWSSCLHEVKFECIRDHLGIGMHTYVHTHIRAYTPTHGVRAYMRTQPHPRNHPCSVRTV